MQKWPVQTVSSPAPTGDLTSPDSARMWRILSAAVALALVGLVGLHLFRGIASSQASLQATAAVTTGSEVRIRGFANPAEMQVSILGASEPARYPVDAAGFVQGMELASTTPLVLAANRPSGQLVGLAIHPQPADLSATRANVADLRISPRTTAHALVASAPGLLDPTSMLPITQLETPELAAPWGQLIAEVARAGDLSAPNPTLELRLAQVMDTLGFPAPQIPGCDGYVTAGACITQTSSSVTVAVGQRWLAVFPASAITPCAIFAPGTANTPIPQACGTPVVFAVDGQAATASNGEQPIPGGIVRSQMDMASGIGTVASYSIPFADLMLGSSGVATPTANIGPQLLRSIADILTLVTQPDGLRIVETLHQPGTSAVEGSRQRFALARLGISGPRFADLLRTLDGGYNPNPNGAAVLAIHGRSLQMRQLGPPLDNTNRTWDLVDLNNLDPEAGR